ncbi:sensor histidine kinase [Amycolatopsis pithecellobii]|uniref:sensor histidine kinase n=1 Tax=Amycolatopsis pithecellobii TaxID=664692 RepID=UPI001FE80925|nr:ATP-binding protein [Amycolatopsis pithecellobii]
MRQGAPVLASTPRELPPEVDDPEPVAAVRRIGVMATSEVSSSSDPLMVRATRYAVLLPFVYRILVLPVVWLWTLIGFGATPLLTAITWVGVAANVAGVWWVLAVPDREGRLTTALLYADVGFAVATSLLFTVTVPPDLFWANGWIPLLYLTGTVVLWTICRGLVAGLSLAGLSIVLEGGSPWLGPVDEVNRFEVASFVVAAGMVLVAVASGIGFLVLVGLGTRLSLAIGMRLGQSAERSRTERVLHDTVLQTLEAIALTEDGPGRLTRVRAAARVQARELRRSLQASDPPTGLAAELAALATDMAREGLRAELAMSDIGDDQLSEVRRIAVRDAAREAMRNTIKHAGTQEVVVRMEERDGGVAVITRDHGVGYDERVRPPGFGVSESMKARLTEVGGWCRIESHPGRGTRVTLWVPR